jgi:hypothetical protein
MQSDPRIPLALSAVEAQCESFRQAVAKAAEQVSGILEARRAPAGVLGDRAAQELGAFAVDRLDTTRFAAMFAEADSLRPGAMERMERARDVLERLSARGPELCLTRVSAGGELRPHVAAALAGIGRAFGAARSVELARSGGPDDDTSDHLASFPFRRWNLAERQIAPPLVVEVDGGELQVAGLLEFLDGQQKIVLVVSGAAPAAPLVRLISEEVTVVQTADPTELERWARVEGPAVIALMPEDAASFTHTPGGGPLWERLEVKSLPKGERRGAIGSFSAFQQRQDLALLRELAAAPLVATPTAPVVAEPGQARADSAPAPAPPAAEPGQATADSPPTAVPPAAAPDPAGQLAAWLLEQSGLTPG